MAVRSRRLTDRLAVTSLTTIYTVPSGRTLIVRSIALAAVLGFSTTAEVFVKPPGLTAARVAKRALNAGDVELVLIDDDVILNPGDELQVSCTGVGATVMAFGSLLDGAPS